MRSCFPRNDCCSLDACENSNWETCAHRPQETLYHRVSSHRTQPKNASRSRHIRKPAFINYLQSFAATATATATAIALHCTALARHPGSHRELRHCKLSLTAHFCSRASPCRLVKSIHHALPFPRKSPAPATSSDRQHRRHYITVLLDPAISVAGSQHYFQGTCQYTPATKCAIAL